MYFDLIERVHELGAKTVIFDVLKGTPERVINASPALKTMHKLGVDKWFTNKRHDSYTKETLSGKKEMYEKLSIRVMPLVQSLRLYSKFAVVGNIFRDKAPKLLTFKSNLNSKPASSNLRGKFNIPQNIHMESSLQSSSWWVTAGFAIALGSIVVMKMSKN